MGAMASQITSFTIDYSTFYSSTNQRNHQSPASLAFVRGIHRWPVNSPHKGPVTRKMFPFDDVIMVVSYSPVTPVCDSVVAALQQYKFHNITFPQLVCNSWWLISSLWSHRNHITELALCLPHVATFEHSKTSFKCENVRNAYSTAKLLRFVSFFKSCQNAAVSPVDCCINATDRSPSHSHTPTQTDR